MFGVSRFLGFGSTPMTAAGAATGGASANDNNIRTSMFPPQQQPVALSAIPSHVRTSHAVQVTTGSPGAAVPTANGSPLPLPPYCATLRIYAEDSLTAGKISLPTSAFEAVGRR
jgi:hypothetical protein